MRAVSHELLTVVMAPPVVAAGTVGAREMRRLPGAGLGIDMTDSEIRVYGILDADADSNGPGSTWGRTQEQTPDPLFRALFRSRTVLGRQCMCVVRSVRAGWTRGACLGTLRLPLEWRHST